MDTGRVINSLKEEPWYRDRIEHIEVLPPKRAVYGELKRELPHNIKKYLLKKNINLYFHQCEAIESLREGRNVIITTPTASGKTLAFNIPIFEKLYCDKDATALYLYPTKALSNDQLKTIGDFERITGIIVRANVYDGDTSLNLRSRIRKDSRIIISNPYALHQYLPYHYKWEKFFTHLKFVVIDEAHKYRGVFGSNVAFLIRRLRRICNFYGSDPQFVLSTATLANPIEFSKKLTGLPFNLITGDSSPKGKKYFLFYNPYFDGIGMLSTHQEAKNLFLFSVKNGLQTLCFTVSRKMAELVASWSKKELKESESYLMDKITAYRAGYLPKERRKIEDNLKNGLLRGVTSTNALELGIDIGSLDSIIISGYPGTLISTWQQAGRAGRGTDESVVTLVAFQNPLDQYFMRHPRIFFGESYEHAIIDLSNPYIISGHLMCAASELPIKVNEDRVYFGEDCEDILEFLEEQSLLQPTPKGWVYSGKGRAVEVVQLNNISSDIFKVICEGELLETMDRTQAYREAHKGAVLLHQGETYIVEDLNLKNSFIDVKKRDVNYHTETMKVVDIGILEEIERKRAGELTLSLGRVRVKEEYVGYKIMKYDKVIGMERLSLPPLNFNTMALWFTIPEDIRKRVKDKGLNFDGGLHGTEHAMIGIMPFYVMCERWDIGGVSYVNHPDTMEPTIFIYDGFEGGIGLTEKAFDLTTDIIKMTYELVRDCRCEDGCPACIYSPRCGNDNKPLDKKAARIILEELLSRVKSLAVYQNRDGCLPSGGQGERDLDSFPERYPQPPALYPFG